MGVGSIFAITQNLPQIELQRFGRVSCVYGAVGDWMMWVGD